MPDIYIRSILAILVIVMVAGLIVLVAGRRSSAQERQARQRHLESLSDKELHEAEARLAVMHLRGAMMDDVYAVLRAELEDEADRRRDRARDQAVRDQFTAIVIGDEQVSHEP